MPLLLLAIIGCALGLTDPRFSAASKDDVLAYATEMSNSALLEATNNQRAANGAATLSLNQQLVTAAQAKANDMAARNYWSHNTPEGTPPWVFIDTTGYDYKKAGENLAYGFTTSAATVTGWMNSPTHKANMLDAVFKEVGFGIANIPNYQDQGQQTLVVAMYGDPAVLAAQTPPPAPLPAPQPASVPKSSAAQQPKVPIESTDTPSNSEPVTEKEEAAPETATPVTSGLPIEVIETTPTETVARVQLLTGGYAPWSAAALIGITVVASGIWLSKHAWHLRRTIKSGERFVLHHPLMDITIVALLIVIALLSRTAGLIL